MSGKENFEIRQVRLARNTYEKVIALRYANESINDVILKAINLSAETILAEKRQREGACDSLT
jgi:NRPS condensation-like uncharacterized protein